MSSSTRAWNRLPRWFALLLTALSILLIVPLFATPAGAASPSRSSAGVTPVTMTLPSNRACQALGYAYEYKVDAPRSGNYRFAAGAGTVAVTVDSQKVYLDWTASRAIKAVVVKGGERSNVYRYEPHARTDGRLHSPTNSSGKFAQISHVAFCYNDEQTAPTTSTPTSTPTTPPTSTPTTPPTSTPTTPLPIGSTLSGVVWSDETGEPVSSGTTVNVYLDNGDNWKDPWEDTLVATTTTDGSGAYTFTGLGEGTYFVTAPEYCTRVGLFTIDGAQPLVVNIDAAPLSWCMS